MTNKYFTYFLIIVITCLGLGLVGEYLCPGQNHFSRSGALVVIAGVLFGLVDINRFPLTDYMTKEELNNAYQTLHDNNDQAHEAELLRKYLSYLSSQNKHKVKLLKFEGLILVTGTLVWGYGGLLFSTRTC